MSTLSKYLEHLFRIALGFVFGYFGYLAVSDSATEAAKWLSPQMTQIIESVASPEVFMIVLGVIQLIIAAFVVFKVFLRYTLIVAALLLVGIIINLGWNELALRDFVIFTAVLYLWSRQHSSEPIEKHET